MKVSGQLPLQYMTYNELKPKLIITRPVDAANLFASFFGKELEKDQIIIMNMCGRGDKDIFSISESLGVNL